MADSLVKYVIQLAFINLSNAIGRTESIDR